MSVPLMTVAVGLGCDRGTPLATVEHTLDAALAQAGLVRAQVRVLATIEALVALADKGGWPLQFFSAAELALVPVLNPSTTVLRYMGTPSVAEAAALLATHTTAVQLLVEKFKHRGADGRNATVSIAPFPFSFS